MRAWEGSLCLRKGAECRGAGLSLLSWWCGGEDEQGLGKLALAQTAGGRLAELRGAVRIILRRVWKVEREGSLGRGAQLVVM